MSVVKSRSVAQVLADHDSDLSESDLAEALEWGFSVGLLRTRPTGLSAEARGFLATHGGLPPVPDNAWLSGMVSTVVRSAFADQDAWSTTQVSEHLGVDASRIRHRARDGGLYALPDTGMRAKRFPRWQFTETGVMPHLREVLTALPGGLHPLEVDGFFTTAQDILVVDEQVLTPQLWLAAGGNPVPVVGLAAALHDVA